MLHLLFDGFASHDMGPFGAHQNSVHLPLLKRWFPTHLAGAKFLDLSHDTDGQEMFGTSASQLPRERTNTIYEHLGPDLKYVEFSNRIPQVNVTLLTKDLVTPAKTCFMCHSGDTDTD